MPNLYDNFTKFCWVGTAVSKIVDDGIFKNIIKGYDMSTLNNDLVQNTELSRPYISGHIAPNETLALKNVNGGARFMTHPTISFAANEAWSVIFCVNYNGGNFGGDSLSGIFWGGSPSNESICVSKGGGGIRLVRNYGAVAVWSVANIINKNKVFMLIADGTGNVSLFVNGIFKSTLSNITNIILSEVFKGYSGNVLYNFDGKLHYYRIQSGALTPAQVTEEYNLIRSYIPEIESVDIGTKTWATSNLEVVATPTGNVIPNVTLGGAVEKFPQTNAASIGTEVNTTTGWSTVGVTLSSVVSTISNYAIRAVSVDATSDRAEFTFTGVVGKYYKIDFYVKAGAGLSNLLTAQGFSYIFTNTSSDWVQYSFINKCTNADVRMRFYAATSGNIGDEVFIDNVSIQELNWANSKELYDGLIAQGYTVANALKEAAMWCYPNNNDLQTGSWAGKLYNKYAVDLLKADMLTANFGWHIATEADKADLLATYPDVDDLKKEGTDYWTSANGTNDSGLTLLGTGIRLRDGSFTAVKETGGFWIEDGDEFPQVGLPIRLVKD